MNVQIDRMRETFVAVWHAADPRTPPEGAEFAGIRQDGNERALGTFVDTLRRESRGVTRASLHDDGRERRVTTAFARLACTAFGWNRELLDGPLAASFRASLRAFPVEARRFDPAIPTADIYQAARNALTAHCLQALLGVNVELTPAVLAYSLLYPYTDNLLDDARATSASKVAFAGRLGDHLRGAAVVPANDREARIFALVDMIAGQFPRPHYPQVFDSLLAIHRAQVRSLALMSPSAPADEGVLIDIAVEKGGTSVLADGYLVAGALTPPRAECLFGLGAFLQLRDDLEDVRDDAKAGLRTVFSTRARGTLDDPTARALAIGAAVLGRLGCFDAPQAEPLCRIMRQSLGWMLSDAAASFPDRYSSTYLAALERRSPFRFRHLLAQRRRLSAAAGSFTGLLERWLDAEVGPPRTAHPDPLELAVVAPSPTM